MVESKVVALLSHYSSLADKTSSSPSSDYIATARKTVFINSSKNLSAINGHIKSNGLLSPYSSLAR